MIGEKLILMMSESLSEKVAYILSDGSVASEH